MKKHEIEALILYASTPSHKKKVTVARAIIKQAFELLPEEKWYVAFSGGKDSTVVFNLVTEIYPSVVGLWCDDEFYLPETADYINRLKRQDSKIEQVSKKVKHTDWFIANNDNKADVLDIYNRYEGVFLGLRAQENTNRRKYLRKYGPLYYAKKGSITQGWLCNPIAWWKTEDVWAYIYINQLDYNRAYDKLSEIGVSISKRCIKLWTDGDLEKRMA